MAYGEDFFSTLENKEACGNSEPNAMWRNVKRPSLLRDEANCSDKHRKLHLGSHVGKSLPLFKGNSDLLHNLPMGKVCGACTHACFRAPCLPMRSHIFSCFLCVCSTSLDVCVYTPGLPSVTHSDIDLCVASACVCVCLLAHIYTGYNWYSNLLPQERPTAAVFQPPEPPAKVQTA